MKKCWLGFGYALVAVNAVGVWWAVEAWRDHLAGRFPAPALVESPAEGEVLTGKRFLEWQWDFPVAGRELVGKLLEDSPVSVEPEMAGVSRWIDDRTLRFTPADTWPAARSIQVKVDTVVTNRHNRVLAIKEAVDMRGETLNVLAAETSVQWDQREAQIRLAFNQQVHLEDLAAHLELQDGNGEVVEARIRGTPVPDEFLVNADWSPGRKGCMTLRVRKGLTSGFGKAGALYKDRVFTIKSPDRFDFAGWKVEQPTFGPGQVRISFTSRPDLTSIREALDVEPSVHLSVGRGDWWRRHESVVSGDFESGVRYRFRFTGGIRGANGQPLEREFVKDIVFPERKAGLEFVHTGDVLSASGAQQVEVNAQNEKRLNVSLERVHANNLVAVSVRASGRDGHSSRYQPTRTLSHRIWEEAFEVENGTVRLPVFSEPLKKAGQGVYKLTVRGERSKRRIERLIVVSDIGLLARRHGDEYLIWAVRLATAEPVADLKVELWSHTRQSMGSARTDAAGLARLSVPEDEQLGIPLVFLATVGDCVGLLRLERPSPFPGEAGERKYVTDGAEAFLYTSRGIYRPGEKVNARAIVRADRFQLPGAFPVQWTLTTSGGVKVWSEQVELNDVGAAQAEFMLREEWPNGTYRLSLGLPGEDAPAWGRTTFQLESFVPPQVVVEAEVPEGGEYVQEKFRVRLQARMLYGGPAASHQGTATLTLMPESFRPSEYAGYSFSDERKDSFSSWSKRIHTFRTDADGMAVLPVTIPKQKTAPSALRAVVGVTVKEFSGRGATAFVSRRVDRLPWYPGVKAISRERGKVDVDLVGVMPDGSQFQESPAVDVEWFRLERQSGYRRDAKGRFTWVSEEIAISEGVRPVTLHGGEGRMSFKATPGETYRVAVQVPDTGASSTCRVDLGRASSSPERADQVELTLNRGRARPGETVEMSVSAPFAGTLLVSVEDKNLLSFFTQRLEEKKGMVRIPIPPSHAPNLWVRAVMVRPLPDEGRVPVLRAEGAVALRLDHGHMSQSLSLEVDGHLRPSKPARLMVRGQPGAEVVVAGVDEGILRLTGFSTPDPVAWFLALRRVASHSWDMFDALLPELGAHVFAGDAVMGGGAGSALRQRLNPVDAKRFAPLSWWSGEQRIPESGVLDLSMRMPEFTGEVRWMAVQVSADGMGHAEAFSKVGRPLVAQQSLPLFLAPGDETTWTVRLNNRDDRSRSVRLSPILEGPIKMDAGAVDLELKPKEIRLHTWRITAERGFGVARCRLRVESGEEKWEDTLELAVRPVEAFQVRTRSRILQGGGRMELNPVEDMIPSTVKRTVRVSSLPVLQLGGAVDYLLRYPYGCLEQTVSSATPALYLPDWDPDTAEASRDIVRSGVHRLWRMQRRDGSFGYWGSSDRASVSGTVLALDFLLEAKDSGADVHGPPLKAGLDWVEEWLRGQRWRGDALKGNRNIAAACGVLAKAGRLSAGWLQRLREQRGKMDARTRILVAEAMIEAGYRSMAVEMLRGLSAVENGGWGWYSRTAENANLLRVLLRLQPQDGRIGALIRRILDDRNESGRWGHTYENAAVIRAMTAYAHRFGNGTEQVRVDLEIPEQSRRLDENSSLQLGGEADGWLMNQGEAVVYVEEGVEGIPLLPPVVDSVFELERTLTTLDGDPVPSDGIRSGDVVVMRFRVQGLPRQSGYMVLDQRLPAGLEPLPMAHQRDARKRLRYQPGFRLETPRHLEVRDDRVLVFPHTLGKKETSFLVLVRAVTPGAYRFPALFAQDMYEASLQARGMETRLRVTP